MTGAFIEVNRVSLRYRHRPGRGPLLMLFHEMGGTLQSWDLVVEALPGRAVLRHDLRGWGLSEKPAGPLRMADHVGDALALLEAVAPGEPVALAGCAVGGAVALAAAAALGPRCTRVSAFGPATGTAAERRPMVLERGARIAANGIRPEVEVDIAPNFWPETVFPRDGRGYALFRATELSGPPASYEATNRMLTELDLSADFARIACPVALYAGRHDLARPLAALKPVKDAIRGATLEELDGGHFMALQRPELVAGLLDTP